jgi:DNA-binding MarR family transcriptional regulator
MSTTLQEQFRLSSQTENVTAAEAVMNLFIAADYLRQRFDKVCAESSITRTQYNILRILKGAYPGGHPRCEIMVRMIERAPDTTRLLDRLEQQGLVERVRSEEDRRLSIACITAKGLDVLNDTTPRFNAVWDEIACKMSRAESMMLAEICTKLADGNCKEIRIDM